MTRVLYIRNTEIHDAVEAASQKSGRSMTKEAIALLLTQLNRHKPLALANKRATIEEQAPHQENGETYHG